MTMPATVETYSLAQELFVKGDYSKLSEVDRARALVEMCRTIGLNPITRPIEFINMQGKLVPYANKDCAAQLRSLNGISIAIVSKEEIDGLLIVHAKATDKYGREDEDFGVVQMTEAIKGEARSNALMKAVTKAKRRVTLSISGLGFLDETDVTGEDHRYTIRRPSAAPNPMLTHNPQTREISDDYADQIEHVIGNGSKPESEVVQPDTSTADHNEKPRQSLSATDGAESPEDRLADVTEKLALCGSVKSLKNYLLTLDPAEQSEFRPLFDARLDQIKASENV